MSDRVNRMLLDHPGDQVPVARVADDELCAFRHGPREAGGEIVENDDRFARVQEPERHVAADIAGAPVTRTLMFCPFCLSHAA